jgi:hypothetical protein
MENPYRPLHAREERFWTVKRRGYVYGILGAAVPLLVTVGLVSEGIAAHLMLIGAAVLAIGPSALALNNLHD